MTTSAQLIRRGTTAAKPAASSVDIGTLYYDTDLLKMQRSNGATWEDCEPAAAGGDVSYAQLLAMQLTNEIKGWPPVVSAGDLDALNLWWDKIGTPTTAPTVVAVSGEGITENYELALKYVADVASEGLSQRWTYADEPRVKNGRKLSALLAIWCVGGVGVTAKLVNSDASETAAAKVTAASWTVVEIPNHTLAGTWCELQLLTDGAGTFYAVPLGANIGARGLPLKPRGLRYVEKQTAAVVNQVDPGGADFTDADFTAATSPLAAMVQLRCLYSNSTNVSKVLSVRRNGDTATTGVSVCRNQSTTVGVDALINLCCDDGQVIEYKTDAAAGDTEAVTIGVKGWWEWE